MACVKLDRLARSVHHLVAMVREFEALGVDLVVLDQAIDKTTAVYAHVTPRKERERLAEYLK